VRSGRFPRPTLGCLPDLGYKKPPPAKEPLHKLSLPILRKAGEVAKAAPAGEEPIQELDDRVFWKVKIARWRGALLIPVESTGEEAWLTAAGLRRKGDADDFYTELGERARRWKAEYNRTNTPPISTGIHRFITSDARRLRPDCFGRLLPPLV
jgi:hypothetical protein